MSRYGNFIAGCKRGRMSEQEKAEIERLAASMKKPTAGKIAVKLNRHPATVNWFMLRRGLITRKPRNIAAPYVRRGKTIYPYTVEEDARLEELRGQGKPFTEIAAIVTSEFGVERNWHSVQVRIVQLAAAP